MGPDELPVLPLKSIFCNAVLSSASLFVEIRERLNFEFLSAINELITINFIQEQSKKKDDDKHLPKRSDDTIQNEDNFETGEQSTKDGNDGTESKAVDSNGTDGTENRGRLLMDATVAPQNIAFPTDLNILNDARKKCEQLIDLFYTMQSSTADPNPGPIAKTLEKTI